MCEIITLYAIFDDDGNVYDICHEPCESMMDGNYDSKKQIEDEFSVYREQAGKCIRKVTITYDVEESESE